MSILCGVDIVYIPRVEKILHNDIVLKKFFHQAELGNFQPEHLAGVIAAKEAFFKALGIVPKFLDIEISYNKSGKPRLTVSSMFQKFRSYDVSISHDKDYAISFVVLQR